MCDSICKYENRFVYTYMYIFIGVVLIVAHEQEGIL